MLILLQINGKYEYLYDFRTNGFYIKIASHRTGTYDQVLT
jgi:hypothetical protein